MRRSPLERREILEKTNRQMTKGKSFHANNGKEQKVMHTAKKMTAADINSIFQRAFEKVHE